MVIGKSIGQLLARRGIAPLAAQVTEPYRQRRAAELENHLTTCAARRDRPVSVADNGQCRELAALVSGCDRTEERSPLRAVAKPVRRIFDVTAGEDISVSSQERSADLELRIWRVGMRALARPGPAIFPFSTRPPSMKCDEHARYRRTHEIRKRGGQHDARAIARDLSPPPGSNGAEAACQHGDRSEVRETAKRE
jgi:hypothetical protein